MAKSKLVEANEKIAEKVVGGYKKIEEGVVAGFTKITDEFVEQFFTREGETVEEAKSRMAVEQKKREDTGRKQQKAQGSIVKDNMQAAWQAGADARRKAGLE